MTKYISVTDPAYTRKDGSEYIIPKAAGSKTVPHLYNKEPVVMLGKKKQGFEK
jgi:hypothetical protein